jgi:acyl-coenzyme A thioesterase PaaI-like protein
MALISRLQIKMGHKVVADHPDFNLPWCKKLLSGEGFKWTTGRGDVENRHPEDNVSNSMFEYTLYSERGVRAHLSFRRPTKEPESVNDWEACFLISMGDGLDGKAGRSHGGLNALLLDHICGHVAAASGPNPIAPATATMTIDYKAPINTPCVILCRGWLIELSGRKVWVRGVIEDGEGRPLATAKALFVAARQEKM